MTQNDQITERTVGKNLVVTLTGQFTGGEESEEFQSILQKAAKDGGKLIVVDVSNVTYINSSFIGGLLAAHTSITRRGGSIVLASAPEALLQILRVTRLDNVFDLYTSVDEALDTPTND